MSPKTQALGCLLIDRAEVVTSCEPDQFGVGNQDLLADSACGELSALEKVIECPNGYRQSACCRLSVVQDAWLHRCEGAHAATNALVLSLLRLYLPSEER